MNPSAPSSKARTTLARSWWPERTTTGDVTIPYNEYSASPTIGRGNGTSTGSERSRIRCDANTHPKGHRLHRRAGPDALPAGQKVIFKDQNIGREVNALRAGVQFANKSDSRTPLFPNRLGDSSYNSVPFGMNFEQTFSFLYTPGAGGKDGITLAQSMLDSRGGTQMFSRSSEARCRGRDIFRALSAGRSVTREMLNARRRLTALAWRASAPPAEESRLVAARGHLEPGVRYPGATRSDPVQDARVLSRGRGPVRSAADAERDHPGLRVRHSDR